MAVMTITKESFQKDVAESKGTVLVDFWASWCGPCRMLSPLVDQVAEEQTEAKVGKINVDEQGDLAEQFKVMTIPTLVVFRDGKETKRSVGVISKDAIMELIK